jgi:hypothetical protein
VLRNTKNLSFQPEELCISPICSSGRKINSQAFAEAFVVDFTDFQMPCVILGWCHDERDGRHPGN